MTMNETAMARFRLMRMGYSDDYQECRRMELESKEAARQVTYAEDYRRMRQDLENARAALRRITTTIIVSECQKIAREALGEG